MKLERGSADDGVPTTSTPSGRRVSLLLVAGILLFGALPPVAWWCLVARVPAMDIREALEVFPEAARASDLNPASPWALVDVRAPEVFDAHGVFTDQPTPQVFDSCDNCLPSPL